LIFLLTKKASIVDCIIGHFNDFDTVIALKDFFNGFGCSSLSLEDSFGFSSDLRTSYLLNTTIVSLENSSIILLLGTNLRIEAPLLNSRIRKNYLSTNKQLVVFSIGLSIDYLTFPVKNLSNSIYGLKSFFAGNSIILKNFLFKDFVGPAFFGINFNFNFITKIFLGMSLLNRFDGYSILNSMSYISHKLFSSSYNFNYFSIISPYLGRITAAELGFLNNTQFFCGYNAFYFMYFCGVGAHLSAHKSKNTFFCISRYF